MTTIFIGDSVTVATGSGHPYEGATGEVIASRRNAATAELEHHVEFPRRVYTQEEMDRGEDQDPVENIVWLMAAEIEKKG